MRFGVAFVSAWAAMLFAPVSGLAQGNPNLVGGGDAGAVGGGDVLMRPQDTALPRNLTPAEAEYLRQHPFPRKLSPTAPPTGPVHCAAEYEPMDGIIISWQGSSSWKTILSQMAAQITTAGDADLYVVLTVAGDQSAAASSLSAAGTNMSRVKYVVKTTDSIWVRDYGPRYIFEGDCRAVVDHTYNRPRPNDDTVPLAFANYKHHAFYEHQLVHGGGNYHLDAINRSYCTRLVDNENPSLTEQQIHDIWAAYQNVDTTFFDPYPTTIDSTQHIDMWMQVIAEDKVIISDWPANPGSTQDNICEAAAVTMAGRGYTVYRVPARRASSVHYTYTNVVMCNNLVLLPSYTNATISPYNAQALSAFQTALPGKAIVQINCEAIVSAAGVMHCIAMHVPKPRGGANPSVYLKNLRGGQVLMPGAQTTINWISDDDKAVTNIDISLSTDGGATYPTTIAAATADDGAFTWTVPAVWAPHARLRLVAHDADGHTGADGSDADFRINGMSTEPGDMNCDGSLNLFDINEFVQAMSDPAGYAASHPNCRLGNADVTGDGTVNLFDIQAFVDLLGGP